MMLREYLVFFPKTSIKHTDILASNGKRLEEEKFKTTVVAKINLYDFLGPV